MHFLAIIYHLFVFSKPLQMINAWQCIVIASCQLLLTALWKFFVSAGKGQVKIIDGRTMAHAMRHVNYTHQYEKPCRGVVVSMLDFKSEGRRFKAWFRPSYLTCFTLYKAVTKGRGFPPNTMSTTPGYFHRKQKENRTKRTS